MLKIMLTILSIGSGAYALYRRNFSYPVYAFIMLVQALIMNYTDYKINALGTLLCLIALITTDGKVNE